MELIAFLLAVLVSSLGLLAGVIIARLAKEELRAGEKYFLFAEDVVLAATLFLLWLHQVFAPVALAIISILVVLLLIHPSRVPPALARLRTSPVAFVLFALILFTAQNLPQFTLFASLALVYAIPAGTLLYMRQRNWPVGLLLRVVLFVGFAALFQLL